MKIEKEKIIGKYQHRGIYGVGSNIAIREDNTFTFHWQTGLVGGTTNGNWELRGNKLILNSDEQPEESFKIIEREKTNVNQFEIKVIDKKEKYGLIGVSCLLMSDTTFIKGKSTDVNGNCILPFDENSNKLQIRYLGYKSVEIPINKLTSNSFILEIKEEDYYRYFTNREWKVKRGRIYDPEIRKDKYVKTNYYERVKK